MSRARNTRLAAIGATALALLAVEACSGDNNDTDGGTDATNDTTQDVAKQDVSTSDVGSDVSTKDASIDASDSGCPASWLDVPDSGTILLPDGGLPANVLLHAAATGTQNYTCEAQTVDGGTTYAWVFVGPQANLDDCSQTLIGHHFASEAGAAAPEWQTLDQSFVIGKKLVAYTPDGGANSVPWLLLQETANGGTGAIAKTLYVQRLFTNGGNAPSTTCDNTTVSTSQNVPYTADYYFYGN